MNAHKVMRSSILAVIAIALGWTFYTAYIKDKSTVQQGKPSPDFAAKVAGTDKQIQLSALKGKGVVLNFWGTWCPPCKQEMPNFEKAAGEFANKGVVIMAVNDGESEVAVRSFAKQYGLTFPLALDQSQDITRLYQIGPLPTTVFIKPDGTVYKKVEGGMTLDTMRDNMQQIAP
ncbi:thiol-disulfide oxidoreductase ResA [Aneurinibacillus terranovensis]|uniref:thiol-disulfide oxidoreductase ResA n=1 Tax=Aneurinibacillus terranovensis TaxID=278991 RepID=UPI00040DCE8F|nr:thiol-disulfide oxidoreductase ResA [Aneurinibacillus terranovensis]